MSNGPRLLKPKSFLVLCILSGFLKVADAQQSSGEKLIKADDPAQITDAVMIADIAVAKKSVDCGLFVKPPLVIQPVAPFQAGSNWLQQMTISLFNRTNKTIVFGTITLQFLDTGDCRTLPCSADQIHFGQIPAVDAYYGRTGLPLKPEHPEQPRLNWEPDQRLTIHVGDYMNEITRNVEDYLPVAAVTKVAVHLSAFFFEDGMRWISPGYSVPDPEHHGRYKYLPLNYFPGKRENNWPPGYDR